MSGAEAPYLGPLLSMGSRARSESPGYFLFSCRNCLVVMNITNITHQLYVYIVQYYLISVLGVL